VRRKNPMIFGLIRGRTKKANRVVKKIKKNNFPDLLAVSKRNDLLPSNCFDEKIKRRGGIWINFDKKNNPFSIQNDDPNSKKVEKALDSVYG
jgi:hypothetical protein